MIFFFAATSLMSGLANLFLGTYILIKNSKKTLNRLGAFFFYLLSLWSFLEFLYRQAESYDLAYVYLKASFLWPFTLSALLHFCLVFTGRAGALKRRPLLYLLIYTPALFFSILELATPFLSGYPRYEYWGWSYQVPSFHLIYDLNLIWSSLIGLLTIGLCYAYSRRSTGLIKKQAQLLTIGFLIPFIINGGSEFLRNFFHLKIAEGTTLSFTISAIIATYAISKYQLFSLTFSLASEDIIENLGEAVILTDPKGIIESINPITEDLFDLAPEEIKGKSITALLPDISIPKDLQTTKFQTETSFENESGHLVFLLATTTPVLSSTGHNLGQIYIFRDFTSLKITQKKLNRTIKKLQNSETALLNVLEDLNDNLKRVQNLLKIKSEFIEVASHQLRGPLTAIKWETESALSQPKISREVIKKVKSQNEKLIETLNTIFRTHEITESPIKIDKEPLYIQEIIESILQRKDEWSKIKDKGISLNFDWPKIPRKIYADRKTLKIVLSIIIRNAIDYTPNGGKVSINIESKKRQGQIGKIISISDNGIGIPNDDKEKVFTRFFRGSNAVKMKPDGTGLNLFLAKKYIEAHGGKIYFHSRLGKGTTFYLWLPNK